VGRTLQVNAAGVPIRTVESQEAEVIWFVRGRTLYRRVLLICPQHDADLRTAGQEIQLDANLRELDIWINEGANRIHYTSGPGFFGDYDISGRMVETPLGGNQFLRRVIPNTLADLTKPENRYAHRPLHQNGIGFPYHPHFRVETTPPALIGSGWGSRIVPGTPPRAYPGPGLPTLRECSCAGWIAGGPVQYWGGLALTAEPFDAWKNPHPWQGVEAGTGALPGYYPSPRVAEDAILNNVIGFDVKAWDPAAPVLPSPSGQVLMPGDPGYITVLNSGVAPISVGAYVDLNYGYSAGPAGWQTLISFGSVFAGPGDPKSRTYGTDPTAPAVLRSAVYDTWSTHYERELGNGRGINGFDDPVGGVADGIVDDPGEMEFPPPYAAPLRGIQVKIRVFEPDSRQVREVTVIQEFVTK
jgi:hypothetical protein